MVAAHLERCAECQAFEASVREFTEELRAAPLQSPRLPIVVRRAHRRVSLSAAQVSVAATLAVAVLGVLSQVGLPGSPDPAVGGRLSTTNLFKTSWQPERELAQLDTNLPGTNRPRPLPRDLAPQPERTVDLTEVTVTPEL